MSISNLMQKKSRITIFDVPVICRFCSHDVFIPYEVNVNVEQPGIGVRHTRDIAICQYCGEGKFFGDPSYYDAEKDNFIWALNQHLLSVRKYKIKFSLYVGKRNNDKITSFIDKLIQDLRIEVENMSDLKGGVGVVLQIKLSSLNDIQTIRSIIIDSAKRMNITIKDLTIK
ncbi:hypothetical protein [Lysinibacillus xylanilyticus]|uniref:hypothetical protein n=1 Tax=Lysinibacillus xylanilyticus TaxID=582475 RepID=UPI003D00C48F